jgi:uncharacterized short protein YbdD (DUF466 family)
MNLRSELRNSWKTFLKEHPYMRGKLSYQEYVERLKKKAEEKLEKQENT